MQEENKKNTRAEKKNLSNTHGKVYYLTKCTKRVLFLHVPFDFVAR